MTEHPLWLVALVFTGLVASSAFTAYNIRLWIEQRRLSNKPTDTSPHQYPDKCKIAIMSPIKENTTDGYSTDKPYSYSPACIILQPFILLHQCFSKFILHPPKKDNQPQPRRTCA